MNERKTAFDILYKIEYNKAYSNLILDNVLNEGNSNSSFIRYIVYGVIERKITLDYILSKYLKQPIKKLKPQVLIILRMGVFQLKFMNSVPTSAAVNESVKLCKSEGCSFASGLVNSVLRKISTDNIFYPDDDSSESLSVIYSCPVNLVNQYINDYGMDNAKEILESSLKVPPIYLRINSLKSDIDQVSEILEKNNFEFEQIKDIDNCIKVISGNLFETNIIDLGLAYVQDLSSQICVKTLNANPGETVFDMCAAPGSKSYTIAQYMNNEGKIYSFDLHQHRVDLINKGAKKLDISIISANKADSSVYNEKLGLADKILCDVPCAGLGVIRRKPEIKYKDLGQIDNLSDLQYNILLCSSKYLKVEGSLIYSTCSLNKKENEMVCDRFLSENKKYIKDGQYLTLMPHKYDTDGFFIARFKRIK